LERLWVTYCSYWDTIVRVFAGVGNHRSSNQGRTIPVRPTVRRRGGGSGATGSDAGDLYGRILVVRQLPV